MFAKERHLEIIRDTSGSNFLNRYCKDLGTKVGTQIIYLIYQDIMYYVEFGPGNDLTFHRGDKTGPVIATADCCQDKQGSSKIQMLESSTTVTLEHIPRRALILSPKTTFSVGDDKYYWKGYSDLFDEKKDRLLAQYQASSVEGADNKIGHLSVAEGDDTMLNDLVVISAFIMQQRADARKRAVYIASQTSY